jgi:hypothetical protein
MKGGIYDLDAKSAMVWKGMAAETIKVKGPGTLILR